MKRADAGKSHNYPQKYPSKLARRMLRGRGFRALRVQEDGKYQVRYFRPQTFTNLLEDAFMAKGVVE